MGFLLAVKDFNPTIGEGALLALFGVVGVFLVLLLLVGCLMLFKLVFQIKLKAKTQSQPVIVQQETEFEEETIAAIIAAISMMYETEQKAIPPFKIKNIKLK